MSYTLKSRVRYSEIGEDERLALNGIVNYFQDCTTFHSQDVGLGLNTLESQGKVWVLSSWQIVVQRYPQFGEEIEVSTWPYAFKGFQGSRNFTMKSATGELLAYANSLWIFMDLEKGRPAMLKEEFVKNYQLEEPLDMEYAGRKIVIPEESEIREAFPVRTYHLDTNHHVNNGQYVQMAREFIPKEYSVYGMRAEYKKQATLGDVITPKVYGQGASYTVALCQEDGQAYAVVEFSLKGEKE